MTTRKIVILVLGVLVAVGALLAWATVRISRSIAAAPQVLSEHIDVQITENLRMHGFRYGGVVGVLIDRLKERTQYPPRTACDGWVIVSIARHEQWLWGKAQSWNVAKCGGMSEHFLLDVKTEKFQYFRDMKSLRDHLKQVCPECGPTMLRPLSEASDQYLLGQESGG